MLSLTSKLKETMPTDIGELPVNLVFNNVLDWYEISENENIDLMQKIKIGWQLFFNGVVLQFDSPDDYEVAANALGDLSEYINYDPYVGQESNSNDNNVTLTKSFSYKQDAEAIYASFIFDYGIDLLDQKDKMRWEKFRALFNNLSPKSPFKRIVEIRQRDTSDLKGKALTDLVEAQNYYALKGQSTNEIDDAIGAMFEMLFVQAKQGQ